LSCEDDAIAEPAPSPHGRLRSAVLLLDVEDLALVAALAEKLVERRREVVRRFDRVRSDVDEVPRRYRGKEREG
jgi:hypothetical protein